MKNHSPIAPGLYIVATPIGNLRDITLRALEVLAGADLILCEDTRTSARLLQAHAVTTPTLAYHEHNAARQRPRVLRQLMEGQTVALISDAGTPLISDPGYKLVQEAREAGIAVVPIPGACAAITALCAAGLATDQFHFAGFLPPKSKARQEKLAALSGVPGTLVFYESPKRLAAALADMAATLGVREAVIARELTKKFEEFRRGALAELADYYASADTPKGEIVVLVGPSAQAREYTEDEIERMLRAALAQGSVKEAAAEVAALTGLARRELYRRALELKA